MNTDRIIVGVVILAAVLWLRQRARKLGEDHRQKAMIGLFVFLIPALIGARWAFDALPEQFHLGRYESLGIQIVGLGLIFSVVVFGFMNPKVDK